MITTCFVLGFVFSTAHNTESDNGSHRGRSCRFCLTFPIWTPPHPSFFLRFIESVLTRPRVGLYYKLHGVHRPDSMKKGVIKRRKRVPAAAAVAAINASIEGPQAGQFVIGLPPGQQTPPNPSTTQHHAFTNGLTNGVSKPKPITRPAIADFGGIPALADRGPPQMMTERAAAEVLVAVGRRARQDASGDDGDGEDVPSIDGEPKRKRVRRSPGLSSAPTMMMKDHPIHDDDAMELDQAEMGSGKPQRGIRKAEEISPAIGVRGEPTTVEAGGMLQRERGADDPPAKHSSSAASRPPTDVLEMTTLTLSSTNLAGDNRTTAPLPRMDQQQQQQKLRLPHPHPHARHGSRGPPPPVPYSNQAGRASKLPPSSSHPGSGRTSPDIPTGRGSKFSSGLELPPLRNAPPAREDGTPAYESKWSPASSSHPPLPAGPAGYHPSIPSQQQHLQSGYSHAHAGRTSPMPPLGSGSQGQQPLPGPTTLFGPSSLGYSGPPSRASPPLSAQSHASHTALAPHHPHHPQTSNHSPKTNIPSIAELEAHYRDLQAKKSMFEDMVERTEWLMASLRKGIEEKKERERVDYERDTSASSSAMQKGLPMSVALPRREKAPTNDHVWSIQSSKG
jgi:hypothetical protein